MLYVISFIVFYISLLSLNFIYFLTFEDNVSLFFNLNNFIEPLIPATLIVVLGVFLGKITKSKDKKKNGK